MAKIKFTVHEFLAIMGYMDEELGGRNPHPDSVFNDWYTQWRQIDDQAESMAPMERADFLFDGRVNIKTISEPHLIEVIKVVEAQVAMHKQLLADNDPDADEDDLDIWERKLVELNAALKEMQI
ncbi:MAG: hypothetical protein RIC16_14640 [Rhodospirillales bacterium]